MNSYKESLRNLDESLGIQTFREALLLCMKAAIDSRVVEWRPQQGQRGPPSWPLQYSVNCQQSGQNMSALSSLFFSCPFLIVPLVLFVVAELLSMALSTKFGHRALREIRALPNWLSWFVSYCSRIPVATHLGLCAALLRQAYGFSHGAYCCH